MDGKNILVNAIAILNTDKFKHLNLELEARIYTCQNYENVPIDR